MDYDIVKACHVNALAALPMAFAPWLQSVVQNLTQLVNVLSSFHDSCVTLTNPWASRNT